MKKQKLAMTQIDPYNINKRSWNGEELEKPPMITDHDQPSKTADIIWTAKAHEFFSSDWSVAGLRYVVMSNALLIRRFIWFILVLFGFGFMIYQFYDRITYFLSHPTSADIKINHKSQITFPTVTICNENIVYKSDAATVPGFSELIPNMYPAWPDPIFVPNFTDIKPITEYLRAVNISWDYIWSEMSPAKNRRFMERCTFNGRSCLGEVTTVVPTSMGYCLQFNGATSNYTSTQSGASKGLYMLLNSHQDEYLYTKSRAAGFRVLLHTKDEVPLVEELGFKMAVNHVTSVALKLKTVTNLPLPYGNCSDTDGYVYTKCVDNCLHEYIIQQCNCRFFYYKAFSDMNVCDPQQQYECADAAASRFREDQLLENLCTCPPQCNNDFYQFTLSAATSSDYAMKTIAAIECGGECNTSEETSIVANMRNNYGELEIYFDELLHEEVKTNPSYNLLALLCDIGGALGLILGSTVLTFFEIVDFIMVMLYNVLLLKSNSK